MSSDLGYSKSELRLRVRAARRAIVPEERAVGSVAIVLMVSALPELNGIRTALLYSPMSEEVDISGLTEDLLASGVRVALPRVVGSSDLALHWVDTAAGTTEGAFGILEPLPDSPEASPTEIDIAIVPGVAYDANGHRLGLGAGYYDRLLARMDDRTVRIGVAFDQQIVSEVPHGEHDRPVSIVVTPTRVFRCGGI